MRLLIRFLIIGLPAVFLFIGSVFAQEYTSLEIYGDVQKPRSWSVDDVKKQFTGEIHTVKSTGREKEEIASTGIPLISLLKTSELKTEEIPKHYDYYFFRDP